MVNVICLEAKGKEKAKIPEIMKVKKKKTQFSDKTTGPLASMETEDEAALSKKRKKRSSTRRKITILDFPLGSKEKPYDLVEDVSIQGPRLTWPQLLHLSPKMRCHWSKMVSTHTPKVMGLVGFVKEEDVLPVLDAYLKGQRIRRVFVDAGAQVCVMTKKTMHQVGLEVQGKSEFKAKMANNVAVKCVGFCRNVKITVCGVKVAVDMYVIPAKREGYPIILGRPWLMAMNARQDWEKGTLILKPPGKKQGETIVYDMQEGRQQCLEEDSSKGSEYSEETTSSSKSSSQSSSEADSSIEVCGVIIGKTSEDGGESPQKQLKDKDLEKMLAKDLSVAEKEGFKTMLRKYPSLFIFYYCEITGVTAVQHEINLKPNQRPVSQKLRRLGTFQCHFH